MIPDSETLDFSHSKNVNFQLFVEKLPNVQFFAQDVPVPDVNVPNGMTSNRVKDIPFYGDKVEFDPLTVGFIVDEHWWSYEEVFNWLIMAADPKSPEQSAEQYSDLYVRVLDNNKNPVLLMKYQDCFPVNLGGLSYNTSGDSTDLQATVQFAYTTVTLHRIDNSKPPVKYSPPLPQITKASGGNLDRPRPPWPDIKLPH